MVRELAIWLRPPDWPALPAAVRPRVRALAWFAIAAQVVFIAGWAIAGALEPGYSPVRMYVSELGRRGAAHPWIFDVSVVVLGMGFVALGIAMLPGLRGRPWGRLAPGLFLTAGVLTMLEAPLRLDCAESVSHLCRAQQDAGTLSWMHYGHQWANLGIAASLVLTPFALARAQWPSRVARLTLSAGAIGVVLWGAYFALGGPSTGSVGLSQRLGLMVVHDWVIACAITLIFETRRGWPPAGKSLAPDRPSELANSVQ